MKNIIRSLFPALAVIASCVCAGAAEKPAKPSAEQVQARLQEIAQELELTDGQKAQITPILEKEVADLKALQEDTSMRRMQKARKARDIVQAASKEVRALLTPEQQVKYDEMRDETKAKMREKMKEQREKQGA